MNLLTYEVLNVTLKNLFLIAFATSYKAENELVGNIIPSIFMYSKCHSFF